MPDATPPDLEEERERLLDGWEQASAGWGRQADGIRDWGLPVAHWMIEHAELRPGERVLELAAGPGDVGFIAAERIRPGGTLICSDATEGMVEIAKARAAEQRIEDVEFRQLQLEWIDMDAASVDAILCRWGVMLTVDPGAALQECRRVLRPSGRLALAVWNVPEQNPWVVIPQGLMVKLGLLEAPAAGAAGMFSMAAPGRLAEMLADAGFVEITVEPVAVAKVYEDPLSWLGETLDCSLLFGRAWATLDDEHRRQVRAEFDEAAVQFTGADGTLRIPGSSLAAVAHA